MMSMNTLMFRECLVLSSKNWSVLLLLDTQNIIESHVWPCDICNFHDILSATWIPWMCQVFEFTGRSPIPDTARVPSLTHGWDPGIFWPRFFLEVFASAVTRSWESLFFKAASDLFFLLFQVSLQQLHCQANYLLKANCATTKSTFCVMPPVFFFCDLHLDKPISWHIGHFTGHACGGPLAKEFWSQFWQTFPKSLAFLLPRFERGILATGLVKWVK